MTRFTKIIRWIVIIISLLLIIAHSSKWDKIQVDWITLALLVIILAIPSFEFIRKIKIGDFEAEIAPKEIEKVRAKASEELPPIPKEEDLEFKGYSDILDIVRQDPQLGLAKLRMEIEKLLNNIIELGREPINVKPYFGINALTQLLVKRGDISQNIASSIKDVIPLANRAIHGDYVRTKDAEEIVLLGIRILEELRQVYQNKIVKPVDSKIITQEEVNCYQLAKYRVKTIIPYVQDPEERTYLLSQEELDTFLEGYNEYAEFIVSIEYIDQTN